VTGGSASVAPPSEGERTTGFRLWIPITILGAAQFVMVLDSSVMNVSISQIVADLDTTVAGVQLAITMYTLVMAAFMLVGARLGDIYGRDRIFAIGLMVYGLGSFITAISPNLPVLLLGWSLVEGIGAVMVIPAIAALIVANYEGRMRALAYGLIGGIAGAAVAVGPLIGGWVTTEFSWRYVFLGEDVVVIAILLFRRQMRAAARPQSPPKLDYVGAALSAAGLGLAVYGILKSSEWGWVEPRGTPEIAGHELTPFGFSPVPFLILGGIVLLAVFAWWEERCERRGQDALLDRGLLKIVRLRAGLSTLLMQQLILMGTFFVLPVYLQVVLGLDAFETGKRLLPMSVTMLLAALTGPRLADRFAPKRVAQLGLAALVLGAFGLLSTIDVELNDRGFAISLAVFGIGVGLLVSQLGNVIMSSVDESKTNVAGGLQGTAQNLGAALGTALIGSVLIAGLTTGFTSNIASDTSLPTEVRTRIVSAAEEGIDVVTVDQVQTQAEAAGLPADQAQAVADDYGEAQLDALKRSLLAVAFLGVAAFWFTRRLPGKEGSIRAAGGAPRAVAANAEPAD
jgi:EmrB/QacA subfamily drug resistance transporter